MLLIANDAVHYVRFDMYPLGHAHLSWHGVRIELGELEKGVVHTLATGGSGAPLFLDREIAPELPSICDDLECAIAGIPMRFTNSDEGDFELSAEPIPGGVTIRFQARDCPWPNDSPWVRGLEVSEAAVRRFVAGLRLEFEQIMAAVPMDWREFPGVTR